MEGDYGLFSNEKNRYTVAALNCFDLGLRLISLKINFYNYIVNP